MHLPVGNLSNLQVARVVGRHVSPRAPCIQLALHDSDQFDSRVANPSLQGRKSTTDVVRVERTCQISSMKQVLPCIGPWTYVFHNGIKTHRRDRLLFSQQQHGLNTSHSAAWSYWIAPVEPRNRRYKSSYSKAKAKRKDVKAPQDTVLRPDIRIIGQAKNVVEPIKPSETIQSGGALETLKKPEAWKALESFETQTGLEQVKLDEAIAKERKLKADYYKDVAEHPDILWIKHSELKGVPVSVATRWLQKPVQSRDQRCGLKRENVHLDHVAAFVSNPNIRQKLISWNQNTCNDLAGSFKEMLLSRAAIARMSGYKSYFEYQSHSTSKMLSPRSVKYFLERLRSQIAPHINSAVEDMVKQKIRDLDLGDIAGENLCDLLEKMGKSIQDFQKFHTRAQINWGDVFYYNMLKIKAAISNSKEESFQEYFPLDHTVRKLLPIFGHLLGMEFVEIFPGSKEYTVVVSPYLQYTKLLEREASLSVFTVRDDTRISERPIIGYLVLDLVERNGKYRGAHCSNFGSFSFATNAGSFVLPKKVPGVFISASFSRSRSKQPTLLAHSELETLMHELGHAIHSLVQGVQGLRQIPRDFIEIPSITGENWAYLPSLLRQISCHYTYLDPAYLAAWRSDHSTSQTLPLQQAPLDMFKEIVYKRNPKNDLANIQYLLWASQFDFTIHNASEEELKSMDFGKICSQILTEWAGIFTANSGNDAAPKSKYLPNNQYLHMKELKSYDTSTYCYLLAKVYAFDIWSTRFAKDPFNKRQGRRYRRIILEHRDMRFEDPLLNMLAFVYCKLTGTPRTSMDALTKFLGRPPDDKEFMRAIEAPASKNQTFWRRLWVKMGIMSLRG